jgi:hypothetical protein
MPVSPSPRGNEKHFISGQAANQPISQSANQPISQLANQPISQSANQPISQSANQPIRHMIYQQELDGTM